MENLNFYVKRDKMAKRNKRMLIFLQVLRWLSLGLAILFFLWLAKNLEWI